jgi:hypothetical protein
MVECEGEADCTVGSTYDGKSFARPVEQVAVKSTEEKLTELIATVDSLKTKIEVLENVK